MRLSEAKSQIIRCIFSTWWWWWWWWDDSAVICRRKDTTDFSLFFNNNNNNMTRTTYAHHLAYLSLSLSLYLFAFYEECTHRWPPLSLVRVKSKFSCCEKPSLCVTRSCSMTEFPSQSLVSFSNQLRQTTEPRCRSSRAVTILYLFFFFFFACQYLGAYGTVS